MFSLKWWHVIFHHASTEKHRGRFPQQNGFIRGFGPSTSCNISWNWEVGGRWKKGVLLTQMLAVNLQKCSSFKHLIKKVTPKRPHSFFVRKGTINQDLISGIQTQEWWKHPTEHVSKLSAFYQEGHNSFGGTRGIWSCDQFCPAEFFFDLRRTFRGWKQFQTYSPPKGGEFHESMNPMGTQQKGRKHVMTSTSWWFQPSWKC